MAEPAGDWDELADTEHTPKEAESVRSLRARVKDAGFSGRDAQPDSFTLLRYVRARDHDIGAALEMFRAMKAWRQQNKIDGIRANLVLHEAELIQSAWAHGYHKTDRQGRPMYIDSIGAADLDALFKVTTPERIALEHLLDWEILLTERFPACSRAAGRPIRSTLSVMDLNGVTLSRFNAARSVVQSLMQVDQDYYPEFLGDMVLVNAPWIFKTIWAMVKPLLGERTQRKVQVFGDSGYAEALLRLVAPENLPVSLGGTDTDICPCGRGPWSDPAYNPALREQLVLAGAGDAGDVLGSAAAQQAAAAAGEREQARAAERERAEGGTAAAAAAESPTAAQPGQRAAELVRGGGGSRRGGSRQPKRGAAAAAADAREL